MKKYSQSFLVAIIIFFANLTPSYSCDAMGNNCNTNVSSDEDYIQVGNKYIDELEKTLRYDRIRYIKNTSNEIHDFIFKWYENLAKRDKKSIDSLESTTLSKLISSFAEVIAACYLAKQECHPDRDERVVLLEYYTFKGMRIIPYIMKLTEMSYSVNGLSGENVNASKVNASYIYIVYFQGSYFRYGIYDYSTKILKEVISSNEKTPTDSLAYAFLNLGTIYLEEWSQEGSEYDGILFLKMAEEHGNEKIKKIARKNLRRHFQPPEVSNGSNPSCLLPPWTKTGFWVNAWGGCF